MYIINFLGYFVFSSDTTKSGVGSRTPHGFRFVRAGHQSASSLSGMLTTAETSGDGPEGPSTSILTDPAAPPGSIEAMAISWRDAIPCTKQFAQPR